MGRGRVAGFLGRHPVVGLVLLTPGIPEYLSGSTSFVPLLTNPAGFALSLLFDVALYGPGVLLIREAKVRWHKGWATVIALGAAYAVVEEGIAVDTMFYPNAGPVGALGSYGHWVGVNWVWVAGIVMVHVVYSISLPILLHQWALPATLGRSLLSRRGVVAAFAVLVGDVAVLEFAVSRAYHFWFGTPIPAGCLLAIAGLIGLGRVLPASTLAPASGTQRSRRLLLLVLGLVLLPGTFVIEAAHGSGEIYPALTIASLLAFYAILLWTARRSLGSQDPVRGAVAFAAGALVPLMAFGVVANVRLPLVLGADVLAGWFLLWLWRKYPGAAPEPARALPPPSAVTPGA